MTNKKIIILTLLFLFAGIIVNALPGETLWTGVTWDTDEVMNNGSSGTSLSSLVHIHATAVIINKTGTVPAPWRDNNVVLNVSIESCNGTNPFWGFTKAVGTCYNATTNCTLSNSLPYLGVKMYNNTANENANLSYVVDMTEPSNAVVHKTFCYNMTYCEYYAGIPGTNFLGLETNKNYNTSVRDGKHELHINYYRPLSATPFENLTFLDTYAESGARTFALGASGGGFTYAQKVLDKKWLTDDRQNVLGCGLTTTTSTTTTTLLNPPSIDWAGFNESILYQDSIVEGNLISTQGDNPIDKIWLVRNGSLDMIFNLTDLYAPGVPDGLTSFNYSVGVLPVGLYIYNIAINDTVGQSVTNSYIYYDVMISTTTTTYAPTTTSTTLPNNNFVCLNLTDSVDKVPVNNTLVSLFIISGTNSNLIDTLSTGLTGIVNFNISTEAQYYFNFGSNGKYQSFTSPVYNGFDLIYPPCINIPLDKFGNNTILINTSTTTVTTTSHTTVTTSTNPNNPLIDVYFKTQVRITPVVNTYIPVGGVMVTLFCDTISPRSVITASNGEGKISNVPVNSNCDYDATKDDFIPLSGMIINDIQEYPINIIMTPTLGEACYINGHIKYSNNTIIPNNRIELYNANTDKFIKSFDSDINGFYNININCGGDYYVSSLVGTTTLRKDFNMPTDTGSIISNVDLIYNQIPSTGIIGYVIAFFTSLIAFVLVIIMLVFILTLLLVIKAIRKAGE